MSDMLRAWGIEVMTPYGPANLEAAKPDLVIIGNVVRRVNPEATAVRERGLAQMSFPAAMGSLFLAGRHSVVVAGTHGKTTTSALMGHVLHHAGRDPSFLVGGVALNAGGNYRVGKGPHVVLEGDEYDTAYFDKGPKFLHYQAKTLILTSVEFDHADIYRDLPHYEAAFERLAAQMPADGRIAVSAGWPNAVRIARKSKATVVTYTGKEGVDADIRPVKLRLGPEGARFGIAADDGPNGEVLLPMAGAHNVENALGVYAAARSLGLSNQEVAAAFAAFQGVKRRQEVRGEPGGVLVLDDFAHHPTAVRETVSAVKHRYPGRRLWAVFEPRSNTSRRNIHQADYASAFDDAARATVKVPERHDQVPDDQALDVPRLVREVAARGVPATAAATVDAAVDEVLRDARPGDVLLVMSNGSFGGFIDRVLKGLGAR